MYIFRKKTSHLFSKNNHLFSNNHHLFSNNHHLLEIYIFFKNLKFYIFFCFTYIKLIKFDKLYIYIYLYKSSGG